MINNRKKIVDNIDIFTEIGKYIDIIPKGSNYTALCPFHADSNPSLSINGEKKIFKCFVCGEGGDVVSFVSKFEKIPLDKAIQKIASENNIKIEVNEKQEKYLPVNYLLQDISLFYQSSLLLTPEGKKGLTYLENRNISMDTIKHFKLGYAYPVDGKLLEYVNKKIETKNLYTNYDIESINQFNGKNDMFSNRLTIPIVKANRIIGFGARELNNGEVKYINSKESNIFHKSESIYNLDEAISTSIDRTIILTEGYFDVISAYQAGVKNCCALMGTNFTSEHLKQILKTISTVYLAFDNDEAGQNATLKVGEELHKTTLEVKVISLSSQCKDLDDFFQTNTHLEMELLKKNAVDFRIFQMKKLFKKLDVNNYSEKERYLKKIMNNISKENSLMREDIFNFLSSNLEVTRDYLEKAMRMQPAEKKVGIVNNKVINSGFLNFEDLIILNIIESKNNFIKIDNLLREHGVSLDKNIEIYKDISSYYQQFDTYDYMTMVDLFPESGDKLIDIYNKPQIKKVLDIEELILQFKKRKNGYKIGGFNR